MKIILIRHGLTNGNLLKRYIGVTDEPLCKEGYKQIYDNKDNYPNASLVYTSTMKRTIETANIIYNDPMIARKYEPLFNECDFGDFENKNYIELSDDNYYKEWIASNGTLPFKNGESREAFVKRSSNAFYNIISRIFKDDANAHNKSIAFVIHGGTIMSILDSFSNPHKDYYNWQIKNGDYIVASAFLQNNKLTLTI